MRFLLLSGCVLYLASTLGCGEGYETRKAPGAGAGDPTAIIQEMESAQPRTPGAPAPSVKEEAADADKAESPPSGTAEEKPAKNE